MKKLTNYRFVASTLWIGFLLAISFMEAPLKFQAELVTLPIGLSVGRVIFGMLNKIEWVLLSLLMLSELLGAKTKTSIGWSVALFTVLLLQSLWLLPLLDARAEAIIGGAIPPSSNAHFYYVGMEILKLTMLVLYTRAALGIFQNQFKGMTRYLIPKPG